MMNININGESLDVKFAEPNQSQIFELDRFYRKIFSECIREGIMTEAEAKKRFDSSGAWTEADDSEIQVLIQKLAFNSSKLTEMSELNEEATELIEKIQKDRSRMFDLISSKTELLSNTAEGMANEQKVFKYISLCLCNEEGKSLFAGQEDLEQYAADNRDDFSELVQKAYAIVYDIDSDRDITEDWAEVQFFSNISKESETKSVAKSKKRKKTTKNTAKKTTKKTTKKNTNKVD